MMSAIQVAIGSRLSRRGFMKASALAAGGADGGALPRSSSGRAGKCPATFQNLSAGRLRADPAGMGRSLSQ
jgi:hypothetical protein